MVRLVQRAAAAWLVLAVAACAGVEVDTAAPSGGPPLALRDQLPPGFSTGTRPGGPLQLRAWRPDEKAIFDEHLASLASAAPGLLTRAAQGGPVEIFRVDRNTGQAHGLDTLAGVGGGFVWIYNSFPRTPKSVAYQAFVHELAHVADQDSRFARSSEFRAVVEPRIRAVRDRVQFAGYGNLRDALLARRDDLARDVGLPSLYAATALQEALAEYVSHMVHDRGFKTPPEVAAVIDNWLRTEDLRRDEVSGAVRRAHRSYFTGRHSEAIAHANSALRLDSGETEALSYRGFSRSATREHARAIEDYSAALGRMTEFDGMRVQVLSARAASNLVLGNWGQTVEDATAALTINPLFVPALAARAAGHYQRKDMRQAAADLTVAIERSPDTDLLYVLRAEVREETGDSAGAIADATMALTKNPNNARAFLKRARLFAAARRISEATADLDRAVQLDPALANEAQDIRRRLN
jgi:tetratricopeptide (TPR) repeat protein